MMPRGLEPAVEAALLRGVLENQPICLLRLGTDGVVLSANDAAQTLVGADGLGEMLGQVFTDWVAPEHHSEWQNFLLRISQGSPASLQCNLIGSPDTHVPVLLHGVPLEDAPDSIRSIGLAVRHRHAEENGPTGPHPPNENQVEWQRSADAAERQRLESVVWDLEERLRRLTAEYEATRKGYVQPSGSQDQGARANERQALDGFDEQQILSAIRDTSVWHQLEASIAEREEAVKQLEHDLIETRGLLEHARADRRRLEGALEEAALKEAETRSQAARSAEAATTTDRDARWHELEAECVRTRASLEEALADRERLEATLREELDALAARRRDEVSAAQETGAHEATIAREQLGKRDAEVARVRAELDQAEADHTQLTAALHDAQAELQRLKAARGADAAGFDQRLETAIADMDARERQLAASHAAERADVEELFDSLVAQHQSELRTALQTAEEQFAHERRAGAAALESARSEAERLQAAVAELEARQKQLFAVHGDERARLEGRIEALTVEHKATLDKVQRAAQQHNLEATCQHEALQQQLQADRLTAAAALAQAVGEGQKLEATVRDLEASRAGERVALEQLIAERELELQGVRESADRRHREATYEHQRLVQQFDGELATARADLDRGRAEHERLETVIQECQTQYAQLLASSTRERGRLEQHLDAVVARHELDLRAAEQSARRHDESASRARKQVLLQLESKCTSAKAELERALADRRQLEVALQQIESRQDQLSASRAHEQSRLRQLEQELASERQTTQSLQQEVASHIASHRAQLDKVAEAETERARLLKVVADSEVTLHALADHARRLAPIAAAGRVALDVSAELCDLIEEVDRRASRVLALCSLDAVERSELERVRAAAISVAALAHQVLDSCVPPAERGSPSGADRSQSRHSPSRR